MDLATRPGPNMPHKRGARKPLRKSTKAQGLANDRCQRFGELERGVTARCRRAAMRATRCQRFGELDVPMRDVFWCQRFGELERGVTCRSPKERSGSTGANASESWNVVSRHGPTNGEGAGEVAT